MEKYHVHTTLSPRHRELLDKYKEKYVTHQKVIEQALDALENDSKNSLPLSELDKRRIKIRGNSGMLCLAQKETLKVLIETADMDRFKALTVDHKSGEYIIEGYYQKPLKECSLKEVMDGLIAVGNYANWFDEMMCTDDDNCYTIKIYHSMGINNSKIFQIFFESLFKTYGARAEIDIAERRIFLKVYK